MAEQAAPKGPNLALGREQPDVSSIGLAKKGAEPVCSLLQVGRLETRFELSHGGLSPPEKIGTGLVVQ